MGLFGGAFFLVGLFGGAFFLVGLFGAAFWWGSLVGLFGGAFWWGFWWSFLVFLVGLFDVAFWWGFLVGLFGGAFFWWGFLVGLFSEGRNLQRRSLACWFIEIVAQQKRARKFGGLICASWTASLLQFLLDFPSLVRGRRRSPAAGVQKRRAARKYARQRTAYCFI